MPLVSPKVAQCAVNNRHSGIRYILNVKTIKVLEVPTSNRGDKVVSSLCHQVDYEIVNHRLETTI